MSLEELTAIRRLEALVELTRLVGAEGPGDAFLDEVARLLADTVGFSGVVINVHRPAWDDFEAVAVVGPEEMRDELLGATYPLDDFTAIALDERFERRGAYFIPDGAVDWDAHDGARYISARGAGDDPDAWHPGDELFVPCRDSEGNVSAIISLGEPVSGRRPSDVELDFLVAVGKHPALALENAQRAAVGRRHLAAFELGGCYLVPEAEALARAPQDFGDFRSEMNGRGPLAWNHHWLFVPLRDQNGEIVGRIWADDPADRLLPSKARLEVLALFANQATMAIVSAGQVERLRALADEDALTGLHNRRAFMRELEVEVERALRYGRPLTLVLCDVDHFKLLNDTHGHPGGDRALCHVAEVLKTGLRTGDGAFRLGGDEFALLLPETTGPEAGVAVRRVTEAF